MKENVLNKLLDFLFPNTDSEILVESVTLSELFLSSSKITETPDGIRTFLQYKDKTVQAVIHSLKYKGGKKAAALLADLVLNGLIEDLSEKMEWQGSEKAILIPVPMSKKRRAERGFNQTELLAEALMERGGKDFFDYFPSVLEKDAKTPPQTSIKTRTERLKNMTGAFSLRDPEKVKGRSVVLIDDVTTTGATLIEARKVLLQGGAKDVMCLSVAH